jgi:hypothetical protein
MPCVEAKLQLCTGLQSRKDVLCALSLGVTERAKLEFSVLPNLQFGSGEYKHL